MAAPIRSGDSSIGRRRAHRLIGRRILSINSRLPLRQPSPAENYSVTICKTMPGH
jgi:hypothetical protein